MAWYDEAVFYHIYPLGLAGAPKQNDYGEPVHRLNTLLPWVDHIKEIGGSALYIGPLFESVGHGYETTDYKKLDSRLGTNEDLTAFVAYCHEQGIKVIFDGVFNHTGRDFFAFKDIQANRENSQYKDWYCNVNFWGNNEYNDGFSYDNWGGYNLLVKLNQKNPAVVDYICDVIRFWVSEFDVDGIRLDAADVLDFDFMKALRRTANEVKPDFWLMGEVIHGDYSRWVNGETLHSVTNYTLHKALYSGHNDHNYFEIAHTVRRLQNMGTLKLYNFVDNHDVERIYTKLTNKAHFAPVHVLLYTLPGVPSIYYGSEFGIEGRKEYGSDDSLRPALNIEDYKDSVKTNPCTALIAALGKVRQAVPALSYGSYDELMLTNRQFAYARDLDGTRVIVSVNNDDAPAGMHLAAGNCTAYIGALSGEKVSVQDGHINITQPANSGEIWVPEGTDLDVKPVKVVTKTESEAKTNTEDKAASETATDAKGNQESEPKIESKESKDIVTATESADAKKNTTNTEKNISAANEVKDSAKDASAQAAADTPVDPETITVDWSKSPESMTVPELQAAILAKLAGNGPVDAQMKKTVTDNIWHDSLVNWLKSFR
ncbi:alpha-amylase family glycosyl hydrolase [Coprococcus eutactus]|uniref:alpha-amylase family glycosyl hydrolase n=1 Tax=Coprococcus eutactus TaxID=33043 RepID=UPI00156FAB6E|nr:alpha-amylase family glycosyl hydrolase [Coprococcus eutactus]NSE72724.1 alpha-amylase [Coprococcus eutactus]